jgi:opacity protein-like surface antigen
MSRVRQVPIAAFAGLLLFTLGALPSSAASATYTVQFNPKAPSGTWYSTANGDQIITTRPNGSSIVGGGVSDPNATYHVRLVRSRTFGDALGAWSSPIKCGTGGTHTIRKGTVPNDRSGKFHFDIEKVSWDGSRYYWTVTADVAFP